MNLVPVEFRRGSQITLEFRKVVKLPCGCWYLDPGPLQDLPALLSTELLLGALQPNLLAASMDGK